MPFVRIVLLLAYLAVPASAFADGWEFTYPLEEEVFFEEADIETSGSAPENTGQVVVKLQKDNGGTWVTVETSDPIDCEGTGRDWGPHNFGPQSPGSYRILLLQFGDPGIKASVEISVISDPE